MRNALSSSPAPSTVQLSRESSPLHAQNAVTEPTIIEKDAEEHDGEQTQNLPHTSSSVRTVDEEEEEEDIYNRDSYVTRCGYCHLYFNYRSLKTHAEGYHRMSVEYKCHICCKQWDEEHEFKSCVAKCKPRFSLLRKTVPKIMLGKPGRKKKEADDDNGKARKSVNAKRRCTTRS